MIIYVYGIMYIPIEHEVYMKLYGKPYGINFHDVYHPRVKEIKKCLT